MFTSDQWIYFVMKNALIYFILSTFKFNACLSSSFLIISFSIQGFLSFLDSYKVPYGMSLANWTDWAKAVQDDIDRMISLRFFRVEKEESDSEVSEANENKIYFEADRKLKDWSEHSLQNKYLEYKRHINEQSDAATRNLNVLEKFCKDTKSRFLLSTKNYAADLEY